MKEQRSNTIKTAMPGHQQCTISNKQLLIVLLLAVFLFPCLQVHASQGKSIKDRAMAANKPFNNAAMDSVHPLPVKSVQAKVQYQGGPFRVLTRKDQIERYKCSRCHSGKKNPVNSGALLSHGDQNIVHGSGDNLLTCLVCHHENDRDFLVDKQGRKIDFDHSYKLCGQCHFRQKKDWVGGAHGKRVTYWTGKRVIYNCATCHNPHAPRFDKRWPATYSPPISQ